MACSDYLAKTVWNHLTGAAAWGMPAAVYLGYSLSDPLGDGSGVNEPTDAAYARQSLAGLMGAAAARAAVSTGGVTFPAATEDQGYATHLVLYDALTEGNYLWSLPLGGDGFHVYDGAALTVPTGDLAFNFPWGTTGGFADALAHSVLNHLFANGAWAPPGGLRLGISLADPGQAGAGINEPGDAAYARVDVGASFATALCRTLTNDVAITFAVPTVDWGPFAYLFLADNLGAYLLGATCATTTQGIGSALTLDPLDLAWGLPWS